MKADSITISALQHYAFCPRQCAYIHIEQAWTDNYFTAKGNQLHQRVHSDEAETRNGVRIERGVQICSERLGIHGKLDLLEVDHNDGSVTPVEYKKGKPKVKNCDRVQLCAQVLCLEEMIGCRINKAALWYWQVRQREWVLIDDEIRNSTIEIIDAAKELLGSGDLPEAIYSSSCRACSFFDQCSPLHKDHSNLYIRQMFRNEKTT